MQIFWKLFDIIIIGTKTLVIAKFIVVVFEEMQLGYKIAR